METYQKLYLNTEIGMMEKTIVTTPLLQKRRFGWLLLIPYDFEAVTEGHIRRWMKLYNEDIDNYLTRKVMNENYGISGVRLKHMVAQLKDEHLFFDEENRSALIQDEREWTNKTIGVLCTSHDIVHSSTWEIVGNLGTSYAVEFYTHGLHSFIDGSIQVVQYYNRLNPPMIFPLSYTFEERVQKSLQEIGTIPTDYINEREIRFSKIQRPWHEDRSIALSEDCYKSIYIGPACQNNRDIIHARDTFLPNTPIFLTEYQELEVVVTARI